MHIKFKVSKDKNCYIINGLIMSNKFFFQYKNTPWQIGGALSVNTPHLHFVSEARSRGFSVHLQAVLNPYPRRHVPCPQVYWITLSALSALQSYRRRRRSSKLLTFYVIEDHQKSDVYLLQPPNIKLSKN